MYIFTTDVHQHDKCRFFFSEEYITVAYLSELNVNRWNISKLVHIQADVM